MEVQIVWFKRDLRTADHAALTAAAARGPVLPVHILEPGLWAQPTASARQWAFAAESLAVLDADLRARGTGLWRARGEAVEILEALRHHYGAIALWSHEETGDAWTFARDRRVAAWARGQGVTWTELPQAGVIRRLPSRDGWARRWEATMARAVLPPPRLSPALPPPATAFDPTLPPDSCPDPCPGRQPGGRPAGLALLDSFLATRGRDYRRAMSAPAPAFDACSRLSPHLAWGTLSTREVTQIARAARATATGPRAGSLDSFLARLHWRCHFMQKLKDEPELEHRALHPALDDLGRDADPARLAAWTAGEIHWPQLQMQAGTTGINTTRIYNPVKQQLDQDPQGTFVRRWCPELARVPLEHLHQPWRMDRSAQAAAGCVIGRDYPAPIVDPATAARAARERIHAPRRDAAFRAEAAAVVTRHASRRRSGDRDMPPRRRRPSGQLAFDL
jgi:deoxyribodipyrimidine photo-lyase